MYTQAHTNTRIYTEKGGHSNPNSDDDEDNTGDNAHVKEEEGFELDEEATDEDKYYKVLQRWLRGKFPQKNMIRISAKKHTGTTESERDRMVGFFCRTKATDLSTTICPSDGFRSIRAWRRATREHKFSNDATFPLHLRDGDEEIWGWIAIKSGMAFAFVHEEHSSILMQSVTESMKKRVMTANKVAVVELENMGIINVDDCFDPFVGLESFDWQRAWLGGVFESFEIFLRFFKSTEYPQVSQWIYSKKKEEIYLLLPFWHKIEGADDGFVILKTFMMGHALGCVDMIDAEDAKSNVGISEDSEGSFARDDSEDSAEECVQKSTEEAESTTGATANAVPISDAATTAASAMDGSKKNARVDNEEEQQRREQKHGILQNVVCCSMLQ